MDKRKTLIVVRLFFGLLTFYAVGLQLGTHLRLGYDPVNYFSYFTNLSNLFLAAIFVIGGLLLWQKQTPTRTQESARGASVVYIAVVGIVYGILLRDIDLGSLEPWINTLLHYVNPVVGVVDWFVSPPQHKLAKDAWKPWFMFPIAYLGYTLVRGSLVGWYPYPFLNPGNVGGYAIVALYCLAILVVFFAISWAVIRVANGNGSSSTPTAKTKPKSKTKAKATKKVAKKATKKTAKQKSRR
ncbi:MAG: Pr6Pr family membrane protein [Anaerolineales bacterium]|nr:Pr6Pr family membrane protein [Anaerolineales bacterium]